MVLVHTIVNGETNGVGTLMGERRMRKRGEQRTAAVLKAAARLFLEHGFEHTTLDMVIAEAGGSRRTIYQQFGNKAGLFEAVVHKRNVSMVAPLDAMDMDGRAPKDTLIAFGKAFMRGLISDRAIRVFRLVVAESSRFPELSDRFFNAGPARTRHALTAFFKRQIAAGRFRAVDPEMAAYQFSGLLLGNMHVRALLYPDQLPMPDEIDAHVAQAVDIFLNGIAAAPSSADPT